MLATMEPKHLAEWQEYAALEPWGDDWERSSMMTARMLNQIAAIAAGIGGKELNEFDAIEDDAFVPKRRDDNRTKRQRAEEQALDAAIEASDDLNSLIGI